MLSSGARQLASGLRSKSCPLKELILSNNDLGAATGVVLGEVLEVNQ